MKIDDALVHEVRGRCGSTSGQFFLRLFCTTPYPLLGGGVWGPRR